MVSLEERELQYVLVRKLDSIFKAYNLGVYLGRRGGVRCVYGCGPHANHVIVAGGGQHALYSRMYATAVHIRRMRQGSPQLPGDGIPDSDGGGGEREVSD